MRGRPRRRPTQRRFTGTPPQVRGGRGVTPRNCHAAMERPSIRTRHLLESTHTNTHKHKQTHNLVCIYLSPQPRATRIPELPAWHRAPTPRPCEDDARLATNVVHRAWRHRDCSDRASAASPHAVVIALRARAGRGGCAHHEKPTSKRALHRERCSSRRWRPATRGAAAATSVGS